MKNASITILFIVLMAGITTPAMAYVGPGAGLSVLGALWGLLLAVFSALGYVLLWPLRRLFKSKRTAKTADKPADDPASDTRQAASQSRQEGFASSSSSRSGSHSQP